MIHSKHVVPLEILFVVCSRLLPNSRSSDQSSDRVRLHWHRVLNELEREDQETSDAVRLDEQLTLHFVVRLW